MKWEGNGKVEQKLTRLIVLGLKVEGCVDINNTNGLHVVKICGHTWFRHLCIREGFFGVKVW